MVKPEIPIGKKPYPMNGELADLFKVMSNQDTLRLLFLAGMGIENSTHAIYELNISSKRYYARLKGLIASGLVKKVDGVYRQTALGRIMYDRFLPAMGRTFEAKDRLELLMHVEGTDIENEVKRLIEENIEIPGFAGSTKIRILGDYEALAIEAIDLYDSAKESMLLASNYWDMRVMEALFRATERGVINRLLVGKKSLSSELKKLRMMLSLTFAKSILNFTSNNVNLKEFMKFVDLPYTFCIVDGQRSIIEVSDSINETLIFALSIDDEGVAKKLTEFYEKLWRAGDYNMALKVLASIGTKLNGKAPHQDSEL